MGEIGVNLSFKSRLERGLFISDMHYKDVEWFFEDVEETFGADSYDSFRRLNFQYVRCPERKSSKQIVDKPSCIMQSTGALEVIALAPVVIIGCTGDIKVDAYNKVMFRGSTGRTTLYLRDTSVVLASRANITASPHLRLVERVYKKGRIRTKVTQPPSSPLGSIYLERGAANAVCYAPPTDFSLLESRI